jgi:hypothetical protein
MAANLRIKLARRSADADIRYRRARSLSAVRQPATSIEEAEGGGGEEHGALRYTIGDTLS